MGLLRTLFVALVALIIGIFLKSDCDKLFLRYLPFDEKTAFAGKTIWLTGGSTGIGASLALDLCKSGAQLIISARQVNKLEAVAKRCVENGGLEPMVLPLDVLQTDQHAVAYAKILEKYGRFV